MRLRTPKEVRGLLGKPGALVTDDGIIQIGRLATRVLEILTDVPIRERREEEKILITGPGAIALRHFPARKVRANDLVIEVSEQEGIIYPTLPTSNYSVTYTVGYRPDDLPAIVVSAITNLIALKVTGEQEFREAALAEIEVIRLARQKARGNRSL